MLSDENAIQTLSQLGLTALEATIYLALCKYGSLNTKTLSKLTKTSQPDNYRVLAKLQEKGLIEKIIDKPAKFKPVSIESSILSLLQKKKTEYDNLKAKTKLLIRTIEEKSTQKPEIKTSQFTLIPESQIFVKKIKETIEKAETCFDVCLSWKRFLNDIITAFTESSEKALSRQVKFRIIVDTPEQMADLEKALQFCRENPICNVRFLPEPPKTVLGIYDKSEVFIVTDPDENLLDSPALWSNNRSLVSVVQDYFESLWLTAMENPKLVNQTSSLL